MTRPALIWWWQIKLMTSSFTASLWSWHRSPASTIPSLFHHSTFPKFSFVFDDKLIWRCDNWQTQKMEWFAPSLPFCPISCFVLVTTWWHFLTNTKPNSPRLRDFWVFSSVFQSWTATGFRMATDKGDVYATVMANWSVTVTGTGITNSPTASQT